MENQLLICLDDWRIDVSRNFLHNKELSKDARMLFILLKSFASPRNPEPFPSADTLMELMGINSRDTLYKYTNELKSAGHLKVVQERLEFNQFGRRFFAISEKPIPSNLTVPEIRNSAVDGQNRSIEQTEPKPKKPVDGKIGNGIYNDEYINTNNKTTTVPNEEAKPPKSNGEGIKVNDAEPIMIKGELFPELPSSDKHKKGVDYEMILSFWNANNGCSLRLTEQKKKNINARTQTFSVHEILSAITARANSEFMNSPEGAKYKPNWNTFFKSDEKIDKWLEKHRENKSKPNTPQTGSPKSTVIKFTDG